MSDSWQKAKTTVHVSSSHPGTEASLFGESGISPPTFVSLLASFLQLGGTNETGTSVRDLGLWS